MDAAGAEELRKRLEAQAHWQQAEAVRDGRQPAADPHILDLTEIRDGVRYYSDGTIKTLVGDAWDTSYDSPEIT